MKMTTLYCDRCKREIVSDVGLPSTVLRTDGDRLELLLCGTFFSEDERGTEHVTPLGSLDLCSECAKSLSEWWKSY